jgi:hypothetical protein
MTLALYPLKQAIPLHRLLIPEHRVDAKFMHFMDQHKDVVVANSVEHSRTSQIGRLAETITEG